ncbi:hypothetical protein GpartN1_g1630.t1 [Galdieria partita]|uniref:SWIM-type domain-containing protein n=1 Tax=Galdieria partita TaxID=83374 RepID=A0A9C7PSU8_9RHOD|nr:hypothetical protein GpartN1_g1630.t1 [Galdieria partita]
MLEWNLLCELVKDVVEKQQFLDEHLLAMHTIMPNTVRHVLPLLDSLFCSEYMEEESVLGKFELWRCCYGEIVVVSPSRTKEKTCVVVPSVPFCSCKQFCHSLYRSRDTGDCFCQHIVLALFVIEQKTCRIRHMSVEEWTLQVSKLLIHYGA